MTVNGVVNKLGIMALLMFLSGAATWYQFSIGNIDKVMALMTGGLIIGFILALVTTFSKNIAKYTISLYAFAEGAALAGISCFFEAQFPGIVVKAVSLTFITLIVMCLLYSAKVIRATETFKSTLMTMTFSIMVFYIISLILSFFHINIPMLYGSSPLAIGFSVFVCGVAAFNLIIDLDFIEQASARFFPKEYEWMGAFGLMVTLVWLYVEILHLLAKLSKK